MFKIQANLDPRHRDRVAFVRVCSGRLTPDVEMIVGRSGQKVRVKGSHRLFARDREAMGEAYPGDIIGLTSTADLRLGDTLCEEVPLNFEGLPQFSPECFAVIRCEQTSRRKQFAAGLRQLADEGVIQIFTDPANVREPILAAVGVLQFDVVRFRLESEYGTRAILEALPLEAAAWVEGERAELEAIQMPSAVRKVTDHRGRVAVLGRDSWELNYLRQLNPGLRFRSFADQLFLPPG